MALVMAARYHMPPARIRPSRADEPRGMRSLVWFRSDLRTTDNTALHDAAAASDKGVVGVYVISPEDWKSHDVAATRVDLVLRTLQHLSTDLDALGIPLIILQARRRSSIPTMLLDLAKDHECDALYFNREYEVDESRRDERVTAAFEDAGIKVRSFDDQVIIPPRNLSTGDGRFYTVFTPFKKSWIAALKDRGGVAVLPAPARRRNPMKFTSTEVPGEVAGFKSSIPPGLWPAGEEHARRRLEQFIESKLDRYHADRDRPDLDGTSTLSPYLAIGAISPRQCLAAAVEANADRVDTGRRGPTTWISELIWREFYVHVLVGFPRVCMNRAFRPETDRLDWRQDADDFKAWCEGRTGYPIVDAAMHQLADLGWMHNRLRMVTAMFLTKDLYIDWRKGERFFMRRLVDGFFASNNGGWQWSASTGTDAAPYFRIFNPLSQSRKYDPEGEFIARYVPELAGLEADEIHDPSPATRRERGYPEPIVDHAEARNRVIAAFKALGKAA